MADAKFCKYCAFDLTQVAKNKVEEPTVVAAGQRLLRKQQPDSGLDNLLVHKYQAMSDSHLLMMLKGDISGQTEKSLSIALAELQTRTSIEWRDMSIAKTRVEEAIIAAHLYGAPGPLGNRSRYNAAEDLATEKAERLAKIGGITAVVSALIFLWGYSYSSNFTNSARAGLMNLAGQTDSTYQLASLCIFLGSIGFLVGLILFIVGMAQRSS